MFCPRFADILLSKHGAKGALTVDELTIRRDQAFVSPQYQGAAKTEKTPAAGQSQAAARSTGLKVSETLQEMAGKAAQMESGIREGRRVLQTGQSALDEIKELYGIQASAIVTMEEVVDYLYNRECQGKVVIDDTLKAAIDAYYEQYGVK